MRKCALVLQEVERELLEQPEAAAGPIGRYARELGILIATTPEAPESVVLAAQFLEACWDGPKLLRAVDALRHALLTASGQAPADWDLINPRTGTPDPASRSVHPGMRVYLEDLRSPFNVGSIFRTADAFGVEELLLSPSCADPGHPRAQRSAMGSIDLLPWKRLSLTEAAREEGLPLFSLELGGQDIESFSFPDKGIAILGSEELGISREARELSSSRIVSIPMSGAKGSLNVAVAFGILMFAWTSQRP
jgi:RNA methyltransferase, TrmH family